VPSSPSGEGRPVTPSRILSVGRSRAEVKRPERTIAEYFERKKCRAEREKEFADKWRFTSSLRQLGRACRYRIELTAKAIGATAFWEELFRVGGWTGDTEVRSGIVQPGITIRASGDTASSQCAGALQGALTDVYPNPPSRIATNQQTDFLSSCGHNCVQVEMDY
jgi:hypothetical protein